MLLLPLTSFLCSSSLLRHLQAVRRTDQLHLPGGPEDGVFLAQPAGGRVLHPGAPALLPRLLAVGSAAAGSAQPHPGTLHRGPHPGHPAHDRPGGVEEQAQRGHRLVAGWGGGRRWWRTAKMTFDPWSLHHLLPFFGDQRFSKKENRITSLGLKSYTDKKIN